MIIGESCHNILVVLGDGGVNGDEILGDDGLRWLWC